MQIETLKKIFQKTDGRCHLTGEKLVFRNYGRFGTPGCWEIEHSNPRSLGGSDHLNNLYPASISANRAKQNASTRSVRAQNGMTRAPLSRAEQERVRENNTWGGLCAGSIVGLPFGPIGVGVGALMGAILGSEIDVK